MIVLEYIYLPTLSDECGRHSNRIGPSSLQEKVNACTIKEFSCFKQSRRPFLPPNRRLLATWGAGSEGAAGARGKPDPGQIGSPVTRAVRSDEASEAIAALAGAEHPQHQHVAPSFVAPGVGGHSIQRPVAARAGQFAHSRMPANRIETRGWWRRPSIAAQIAANRRRAAGPEPGCISQLVAASRSASALLV